MVKVVPADGMANRSTAFLLGDARTKTVAR